MKKTTLAVALGLALVAGQAFAQTSGDSPWLVRFRATHLDMANKDGTNPSLGLTVNNKTIPEVDISYFFSPNLAAELVLTVPQKQTVYTNGTALGTFKHLPPTLLLQYHFTNFHGFKPYVGAGVNYTKISSVRLGAAGLEKDSWGAAVQVGMDVPLTKNWSLNLDLKKVQIRSDVFLNGANQGELKLDPTLFSLGVGYRF